MGSPDQGPWAAAGLSSGLPESGGQEPQADPQAAGPCCGLRGDPPLR